MPERSLAKANEIAKQIEEFFHYLDIPDNSRETVKRYVDQFWVVPILSPYNEKGICGLFYPLSDFPIARDDIIDLIMQYICHHKK